MTISEKPVKLFAIFVICIAIIAVIIVNKTTPLELQGKLVLAQIMESIPETSLYLIKIKNQNNDSSYVYMAHYIANMFPRDSIIGREVVLKNISHIKDDYGEHNYNTRYNYFVIAIFKQ